MSPTLAPTDLTKTEYPNCFKCPYAEDFNCNEDFPSKTTASRHARKWHRYKCPYAEDFNCDEEFTSTKAVNKYARAQHLGGKYPCSVCKKTFQSNSARLGHEKDKHSGEVFQCLHCEKSFGSKSRLTSHDKMVHSEGNHKCDSCGLTLKTLSSLKEHAKIHGKRERFPCPNAEEFDCQDTFFSERQAKVHVGTQHTYRCRHSSCKKLFKTATEEAQHAYNDFHRPITLWTCKVSGCPAVLRGRKFKSSMHNLYHRNDHIRKGDIKDVADSATWKVPYSIPKSHLPLLRMILDNGGFNQKPKFSVNKTATDFSNNNEAAQNGSGNLKVRDKIIDGNRTIGKMNRNPAKIPRTLSM